MRGDIPYVRPFAGQMLIGTLISGTCALTLMLSVPGSRFQDWNHTLPQVVAAGFSVIQSQGWYLNAEKLGTNWETMYANEPMTGVTEPSEQRLILGGIPVLNLI